MTSRERNFFLVAEDLAYLGRSSTAEEIAAEIRVYFGYVEPEARRVSAELRRRRYLRAGRGGRLSLTRRGARRLEEAAESYFSASGLVKSAKSRAFRSLCFERQGLDVCQHGSLTSNQLMVLEQTAGSVGPAHILDLGCGVGEVGLRIAEKVGAALLGVDTSASAMSYASRLVTVGRARYMTAPMECVDFSPRSTDLVLALDSLYWVENPEVFLERCLEWIRPGGALCILQSDFAGERGGARTLGWEETLVGQALSAAAETAADTATETPAERDTETDMRQIEVTAVDFTGEERRLWRSTPDVCEPHMEAFSREGRLFLLRNLMREAEFLARSVSNAPGARYLYVVRPISRR